MKSLILSKIFSFFLLFSLIFSVFSFFINNVNGAFISDIEDMESYYLGDMLDGRNLITTWCNGTNNNLNVTDNLNPGLFTFQNVITQNTPSFGQISYINFSHYLRSLRFVGIPGGGVNWANSDCFQVDFINDTGLSIGSFILKGETLSTSLHVKNPDSSTHGYGWLPWCYGMFNNITVTAINQVLIEGDGYYGYPYHAYKYISTTGNAYNIKGLKFTYLNNGFPSQPFCYDNFSFVGETVLSSASGFGCTDFSGYDNIDLTIGHSTFDACMGNYLEFTGISPISARIRGFEFLVSPIQFFVDNGLDNYLLYLNNVFVGSATCYSPYLDGYLIQWDLNNINFTLSNELPVFELVHDFACPPLVSSWYIGTNPCGWFTESHKRYEMYTTSHIDGRVALSETSKNRYSSPNWILYYSDIDNTSNNPNYSNSITLYDGNHLRLANGIWGIPTGYVYKPIFIDVKVDDTDTYLLYIYDENDNIVGSSQYFPKEILTYHSIYSWIPFNAGNYTISLKEGSVYTLNKSLNVTFVNTSFAIWTTPNPSRYGSSILIGVYAEDSTTYPYYSIGVFGDSMNINSLDVADIRFDVPYFTDGFFYTSTWVSGLHSPVYIRLFASNGTAIYRPITGVYLHYTEYLVKQAFIRTSLEYNTGVVNQLFAVYGAYTYIFSTAKIFLGNNDIYNVATGSFSFNYQFSKSGTYTFYLKEYDGTSNSWFTIDSVTVSIMGASASGFGLPDWVNPIIGMVIVLICTLLPLGIVKNLDLQGSIGTSMCVMLGFTGLCISSIFGFFPFWVAPSVIIITILIIVFVWLSKKKE